MTLGMKGNVAAEGTIASRMHEALEQIRIDRCTGDPRNHYIHSYLRRHKNQLTNCLTTLITRSISAADKSWYVGRLTARL